MAKARGKAKVARAAFDLAVARRYSTLYARKAKAEDKLDGIKDELRVLEAQLRDAFTNAGVQSVRMNGRLLYLRKETSVSALDGDQQRAKGVLVSLGLDDLIGPQPARVRSWVKEREAAGEPLPEEFLAAFNIHTEFRVGSRKG